MKTAVENISKAPIVLFLKGVHQAFSFKTNIVAAIF
jgi:hypothetical protein